MARLTVNGVSLEVFEEGAGEPLVLIHGSASDYRTWEIQRPVLSGHFRVVTYSRRYHWPNERIRSGQDYSMPEHVADLGALLRSLDAAPAHLVGHSYGGFLALLLAMREPDLVRTLVLMEPPAVTLFVSPKPKPQELLGLFFRRPATALAVFRFGARGIAPATDAARRGDLDAMLRIFASATLGDDAFRRLSDARLEQARANLIPEEMLGSGLSPLEETEVMDVQHPTLLLTGARSPGVFHRVADRLEEILPRVERRTIPEASHILHEDNAGAFEEAVLPFLKEHTSRRTPS